MRLVESNVRDYPYGTLAAHVLGHVGEVTEAQLKKRAYAGLVSGDKVGQAGVEAAFDRYLRGTAGLHRLRVDSLGQPRSDITPLKMPPPGNNVRLTIDVDLQFAAERALQHGIQIARNSECTGLLVRERRRDRRARRAERRGARARVEPDVRPALFVGKPNPWRIRPLVNEAPRSAATTPASTARSPAPIRRARRSSR